MRIYTRQGDKGLTRLADGTSLAKDDKRVETYGAIDELNSQIGLLMAEIPAGETTLLADLILLQQELFDLGGELSIPGYQAVRDEDVAQLESDLEQFNADLPPLKEFILPGGGRAAADCHLARAICRRAERRLVSLARDEDISEQARVYLNRLSDLLFVMCRILARDEGGIEVLWRNPNRSTT